MICIIMLPEGLRLLTGERTLVGHVAIEKPQSHLRHLTGILRLIVEVCQLMRIIRQIVELTDADIGEMDVLPITGTNHGDEIARAGVSWAMHLRIEVQVDLREGIVTPIIDRSAY